MTSSIVLIRPSRGWVSLKLHEVWQYRELLYFLTWRDLKVRYKQTAVGVAWALVQPLFTMLVFSVFFGRLAKIPSDGVPYPVFSLAGLVPWTFFANAITSSSMGLVDNANLVRKVYFPRLTLPFSAVISSLCDFLIAFALLLALMPFFGVAPGVRVLLLPLFMLLAVVTALGVGLWLSALNAQYRDVRYALPFLTQFWMFATPIAYPSSLLGEPWRTLYGVNPMVGVVEGFRWTLLGAGREPGWMVVVSAAVASIVLVTGALYFRRMERTFADVL